MAGGGGTGSVEALDKFPAEWKQMCARLVKVLVGQRSQASQG